MPGGSLRTAFYLSENSCQLVSYFIIHIIMHNLYSLILFLSFFGISFANAQNDTSRVSVVEYITKHQPRNKAFMLDLELHGGFYNDFEAGKITESSFRFQDIKLDISGEINDKLYYQYRQRLNGDYSNSALENLSESIEYAYIGYNISDRFTLTAGKQDILYGSYEYDMNPIHIYRYSDMNEYLLCYMMGLTLGYSITDNQELNIQVTNSRNGDMEYEFGLLPEGIEKPVVPLFYTLSWNGSFFDEMFGMYYSASSSSQAKGKNMYVFAAGHCLDTEKIHAYVDVMYTRGGIDPFGLVTELNVAGMNEDEEIETMLNCDYFSVIAELQYRFNPKWKVFAKGTYETAGVYKSYNDIEKGKYRTNIGWQAGVEFFPMADDNMRLFLMGLGNNYQLTQRALNIGAALDNTACLSLGIIYRLPVY